jgi:tetratricopeptide (TPR) repeat protein
VSDFYFRQGVDFVFSHPGDAAVLLLKKLRFFWTSPELSNDKFIHFFWGITGLGKVPLPGFWLVTPLAILGAILQWRRRRELAALYLFLVLYSAVVVAFFVIARFRLPVVPVLIIFAAFAALHMVELFRINKQRLLAYCAVLALLAAAVNHNAYAFHKRKPVHETISRYTLGSAYLQSGDKESAIEEYELARASYWTHRDPGYELIAADVNSKLAALYYERGNCEKTVEVMDGVRGGEERTIAAMTMQAECLLRLQRFNMAVFVYQDILRFIPGYPPALIGLANVYESTGQLDKAESTLTTVVRRPDGVNLPALIALARVHLRQGKTAEAIAEYTEISGYEGYEGWALVVIADIYIKTGDMEKARQALDRAAVHLPEGDPTVIRLKNLLEINR